MAISKLTYDYSTRKKDVSILHGADPSKIGGQLVDPSFGLVSQICAGPQKLAQRYAIYLLTALESQPNFPLEGTNFLTRVSNGVLNIADVAHIFNLANSDVLQDFDNYERENPGPLDERLSSAVLQRTSVSGSIVSLDIKLTTVAGDDIEFLVPLPK